MNDYKPGVYTPPKPIDMEALCLVAAIEEPCREIRINIEDWYRLDMPVWCGVVPIVVSDDVEPNSIHAVGVDQ